MLSHLFPGIEIEANLPASGQRLVYFCNFPARTDVEAQRTWSAWGDVVLKLSEDIHPTVLARVEKEREILDALSSPYYPRQLYFQVFADDPVTEKKLPRRLFISIEQRVAGLPLAGCRDSFRTELQVLSLLRDLVDALALIWELPQRIIHRDLKPENILIGRDGRPVIIDLGIAREQGSAGVTGTGWQPGPCTAAYASPEQIKNEKRIITFKADFFSLGVIVYELLTGTNPFKHGPDDPVPVVLERALNHEPPSLSSLGLASDGFSALVERMMAKQAYQRPRTVSDLRAEVNGIRGIN